MPAPDPSRQPTVLRLGDMSGIVTAVSHMLGFQPAESLVAVALRGPRERMHFALRLDLPVPEDRAVIVAEVTRRMAVAKADGVLLFVYTGEPPGRGDGLPQEDLVSDLVKASPAPVADATLVSSGRMWSYLCCDERCCPRDGRVLEADSPDAVAVAAAHALEGRAVLPDRDSAVAGVRPLGGIAAISMLQALDRARIEFLELEVDEFSERVAEQIDVLTSRFADPRAVITDDEAARVTLALHDIVLRDELLVRLADDEGPLRRALQAVARRAQPPDDAPICTLVALAAYADGNGLVAGAALDRALQSDPDYTMAQLIRQLLDAQVPPEEIRKVTQQSAAEVRALVSSRRQRRR
jgi:hypothetical protein